MLILDFFLYRSWAAASTSLESLRAVYTVELSRRLHLLRSQALAPSTLFKESSSRTVITFEGSSSGAVNILEGFEPSCRLHHWLVEPTRRRHVEHRALAQSTLRSLVLAGRRRGCRVCWSTQSENHSRALCNRWNGTRPEINNLQLMKLQ